MTPLFLPENLLTGKKLKITLQQAAANLPRKKL
jgi:hypothetical protein